MRELRFEWDDQKALANIAKHRISFEAGEEMRAEYDFRDAKTNPYAKRLKKQITIRIDEYSIDYFKQQAAEVGIPYQSLINLYLADCASNEKKLSLAWD
ncbi:MAG: BrnA antitoxin family protein [Coriobacteriales bacterium]|jgi:predicted DNA binding CopG/RHH family protein|nr:BrnA antitoxin family protein [Coriobacteriales bacterium]